jgi:hypothetical protein
VKWTIFSQTEPAIGITRELEVDSLRNGKSLQVLQVPYHVFSPTYAKDQPGFRVDNLPAKNVQLYTIVVPMFYIVNQ